jgi:hypothetical protein
MISRRMFLGLAAAVPVGASPARAAQSAQQAQGSLSSIPVRKTGKVEIAL